MTFLAAVAPGVRYLVQDPAVRRPIPFLPVIGLIYGLNFGFPFAFSVPREVGHGVTVEFGSALVVPAGLALMGWLVVLGGYWLAGKLPRPGAWNLGRFSQSHVLVRAGALLMVVGILRRLLSDLLSIPAAFGGLWSLVGTLGWVGAGVLVVAWSRGLLG